VVRLQVESCCVWRVVFAYDEPSHFGCGSDVRGSSLAVLTTVNPVDTQEQHLRQLSRLCASHFPIPSCSVHLHCLWQGSTSNY
jgi:hypothetical protein